MQCVDGITLPTNFNIGDNQVFVEASLCLGLKFVFRKMPWTKLITSVNLHDKKQILWWNIIISVLLYGDNWRQLPNSLDHHTLAFAQYNLLNKVNNMVLINRTATTYPLVILHIYGNEAVRLRCLQPTTWLWYWQVNILPSMLTPKNPNNWSQEKLSQSWYLAAKWISRILA